MLALAFIILGGYYREMVSAEKVGKKWQYADNALYKMSRNAKMEMRMGACAFAGNAISSSSSKNRAFARVYIVIYIVRMYVNHWDEEIRRRSVCVCVCVFVRGLTFVSDLYISCYTCNAVI